jgi:hypothetical protein
VGVMPTTPSFWASSLKTCCKTWSVMSQKLWTNCTHQALDPAQRLAIFEVTSVDVVDTKESSDGRGGRVRTEGLLGLATRMRRVDDDRLMMVGALSVGV